jgi:hypothetical protein
MRKRSSLVMSGNDCRDRLDSINGIQKNDDINEISKPFASP